MNFVKNIFSDHKKLNTVLWIVLSIALVIYKFTYHELWKDEWQAYLVARDLRLGEMLSFLNYEGHPSLWYLYLKIWTFLPGNEESIIQAVHSLLCVIALYFLFIRISLPTLWKLLIALSYFIAFEYGVINRGYILVILFSLIAVDLIVRGDRSWKLGLTLLLLCQTEAYGVIIAASILVYLLLNREGNRIIFSDNKKTFLWAIAGFVLFVFTVIPRGNKDDFSRAYNQESFDVEVIQESIQGHLANVFTIGLIKDTAANGISLLGLIISILLLGVLIYVYSRDKRSLISFLFGLFGFILFGIVIFTGGVRQWGMVFILFVIQLVLSNNQKSQWTVSRYILVTLLMIAPVIHGFKALVTDARLPFSNAKEVGLFISDKVPMNVPIVVINKFETAPVGAYAQRALYELPSGEEFTYFKWLEKVYIPTQSELDLFTRFKKVGGIVLLSPEPIDANRFPSAQLWKTFNKENFKNENYWLYSVPLNN